MNPQLKWPGLWFALTVVCLLVLVVGSLMSPPNLNVQVSDKTMHIVAYGLLGTWLVCVTIGRSRWVALIGLLVLGGVLELIQSQVGRTADYYDMIANSKGVCIAAVIAMTPLSRVLVWFERCFD